MCFVSESINSEMMCEGYKAVNLNLPVIPSHKTENKKWQKTGEKKILFSSHDLRLYTQFLCNCMTKFQSHSI